MRCRGRVEVSMLLHYAFFQATNASIIRIRFCLSGMWHRPLSKATPRCAHQRLPGLGMLRDAMLRLSDARVTGNLQGCGS